MEANTPQHLTPNQALNLLWLHETGQLDDVDMSGKELNELHRIVISGWSRIDSPYVKFLLTDDYNQLTQRIVNGLRLFHDYALNKQ